MKNVNKIVGFTASSFDLLHTGHVLMLEECKQHCDYLIVGLNTNPSGKVTAQSTFERFIQLSAVKYVDKIIPYDTEEDLLNILQSYDIDVRFVGEEYKSKLFTGCTLDIPLFYNSRRHNFSTTELKRRIVQKFGKDD